MVADRLGVSKSTVSRALKGDGSISAVLQKRVVALAKDIGYRPNAAARNLATRRSGVVGFIIGEGRNPFYAEQIDRLIELLSAANLQLMMFRVPDGGDVVDVVPTLLQYQLDACIIASVANSSRAESVLIGHRLPTVLLNRIPIETYGSAVLCNNRAGARQIAQLFIECGARRPAFIAGPDDASTSREREEGFISALAAAGLRLAGRACGDYRIEGSAEATRKLMALAEPPDAVFVANDYMALGTLDALRLQGIRVPEEVQVAGFDDVQAAAWPAYDLTTIAQPVDQLLERTIRMLHDGIAETATAETVYVNGTLMVRGSTKRLGGQT